MFIRTAGTAAGSSATPSTELRRSMSAFPQADGSLYKFPTDGDENAMVMLSDILPTMRF